MDYRRPLSITTWSLGAILMACVVAAVLVVSSMRRPERTTEALPRPSSVISDQLKAEPVQVIPAGP